MTTIETPKRTGAGARAAETRRRRQAEQIAAAMCATVDTLKPAIGQAVAAHVQPLAVRLDALEKVQPPQPPRKLTIEIPKLNISADAGVQHFRFGSLLQILSCGLHAYLVGPAGSGKTTAAEKCADMLKLDFYCQSVGAQTTQAQLLGYMDATGKYVGTVFRSAFEKGGVFLLDEVDAGNANVLTILNAALANGTCSFPDGMVKRHKDFRCVAAANTFGTGADRQYVGRNQLDAASIDRFAFLEWPYDESLERHLTGNDAWVTRVQAVRKAVARLKIRHVVSPRASFSGAKMLAAGVAQSEVEDSVLWKGMDFDSRAKVGAAL
jgi:cobaltochelatase CobS